MDAVVVSSVAFQHVSALCVSSVAFQHVSAIVAHFSCFFWGESALAKKTVLSFRGSRRQPKKMFERCFGKGWPKSGIQVSRQV